MVISISLSFVVCFVFRDNHYGIVSDLQEYADENMKIGEIEVINVLVTQAALLKQNRSTITKEVLKSRFMSSMDLLLQHKTKGHIYSI